MSGSDRCYQCAYGTEHLWHDDGSPHYEHLALWQRGGPYAVPGHSEPEASQAPHDDRPAGQEKT